MIRRENTALQPAYPEADNRTPDLLTLPARQVQRMSVLRSIFLVLFTACVLAPAVAFYRQHLLPGQNEKLGGVEVIAKLPEFSISGFLDGSFQQRCDAWFSTHLGLRGAMIRTDNQLNFSLFNFNRNKTVLGKNNFLYETYYLEDYNRLRPFPDAEMKVFVNKLLRLRGLLEARGVKFLVMLTPSKVTLHPEYVPERFLFYPEGPGTYERFRTQLEAARIPLLDTVSLLKDLKAREPYPVFAPGGAHWTPYACCKAGEQFTSQLDTLLGRDIAQLRCDPPLIREKAEGSDTDLSRLANLWSRRSFDLPLPYPRVSIETSPETYRPKILFIGDSFMWSFFHFLEKRPVYETRDFYYYYQAQQRYRARQRPSTKQPLDRAKIDWNYVFARDLIVLELNEVRIREGGFGFIEDALQQLESRPPG